MDRPLYAKRVLTAFETGPATALSGRVWGPVFRACGRIELPMKAGIHPAYEEINVVCACGHTFRTRSAHKGDIRVEICSSCHPFFTGKQKLIDTEGRVDRFTKKYQKVRDAAAATKTAAAAAKEARKKQPTASV